MNINDFAPEYKNIQTDFEVHSNFKCQGIFSYFFAVRLFYHY